MSADARLHAPATQRNRDPILAVLRRVLPAQGTVLELASGTGQHAVYFAPYLAPLRWQPSDPAPVQLASIRAWAAACPADNLLPPLLLDATQPPWPVADVAAVICINMIHIAPWRACAGLLRGAAALLPPGAPLYLYGPFRVAGQTAPSNEDFDRSLRSQDPAWGVRELEEVASLAATHGLVLAETVAMPANNLSVIFRREAAHA